MQIWLAHGRDSLTQEMDDWGYDGPVLGNVHSVQQMYGETTTVRFTCVAACKMARQLTGWAIWDERTLEVAGADGLIAIYQDHTPARYFADLCVGPDDDVGATADQVTNVSRRALQDALRLIDGALRSLRY